MEEKTENFLSPLKLKRKISHEDENLEMYKLKKQSTFETSSK